MVEIREGERISGEGELGVTLLVDIEQIGCADVRWQSGAGIQPPLHFHARHAELFFVLEGELMFRLEDRQLRAGAGTWTFIPPSVVHSFEVTGDSPAHFLNIHTPSCGFGDFVRALYAGRTEDEHRNARAAFDQQPPPEYATGDPNLVVVRRTGGVEGEKMTDRPGRRATLLVDADELTVSEFLYGSGERGAGPHVHRDHADAFLVLEGELTLTGLPEPLRAPAGTLVVIPPNVVHGFDNDGAETMLVYNFHLPALGFADYLRGRNPDFDQHDPPADGGADPTSVVAVHLSGQVARMPTTWDELVTSVTARHPGHESKMFGMPCLKRENGKVVAGHQKDGGVNVKLGDEAQREAALAIPGAEPFDPGMGRVMKEWVLVPASLSDDWERLVEQAVG